MAMQAAIEQLFADVLVLTSIQDQVDAKAESAVFW